MQIWIDNTGLHSAAHCLENDARGIVDIKGFLQLAFEIVFCERISISGFESSPVASRSRTVVENLVDLGLEDDAFLITSVDETAFREACLAAADEAAQDVGPAFNPLDESVSGLEPDLAFNERAVNDSFHEYILGRRTEKEFRGIVDTIFESFGPDAAYYAVHAMVASSPNLAGEVHKKMKSYTTWSIHQTRQLGAFCRYYLNDTLAKTHSSTYAPAVARAELIRASREHILQRLSSGVDRAFQERFQRTIDLPAWWLQLLIVLGVNLGLSSRRPLPFGQNLIRFASGLENFQLISILILRSLNGKPTKAYERSCPFSESHLVLKRHQRSGMPLISRSW